MDGILVMDKPEGFTSFDVVAKMRGMLKTKKIGHAGTLDPMATGVLPLFIGRATKCCDILPNQDKRYIATFQLGMTTDTLDRTGKVLSQSEFTVDRARVEEELCAFRGEILQLPPMYSAVQINGQRLYTLARQGLEVEREARKVTIYGLTLLDGDEKSGTYSLEIACSKGTYIRSICADLGEKLGCGAVMTALRRTEAAGHNLASAITMQEAQRLTETGELAGRILPVDTVFASLPALHLEGMQERLYRNGVRLSLDRLDTKVEEGRKLRVYSTGGEFLGISYADCAEGLLISRKFFAAPMQP